MKAPGALLLIKLVHTVIWAFFAGCIVALPIAAHGGRFGLAAGLIVVVLLEVLVLAANHWSCPLTGVAARYTGDRQDNFDIFLPALVARYNKAIFGTLFVAGIGYTLFRWWVA